MASKFFQTIAPILLNSPRARHTGDTSQIMNVLRQGSSSTSSLPGRRTSVPALALKNRGKQAANYG